MTLPIWKTDCGHGCSQEVGMNQKRERFCEHGRPYVKVRPDQTDGRVRRYSAQPDRDWTDARAKVDDEGCCRICKASAASGRPLEAAHILGREHDEPKVSRTTGQILKELYVDPDRIVPACGPFPAGCHGDVHAHQVNLVHYLTMDEQIRAVKDASGIAQAWVLLARVEHREEVERERAHA